MVWAGHDRANSIWFTFSLLDSSCFTFGRWVPHMSPDGVDVAALPRKWFLHLAEQASERGSCAEAARKQRGSGAEATGVMRSALLRVVFWTIFRLPVRGVLGPGGRDV